MALIPMYCPCCGRKTEIEEKWFINNDEPEKHVCVCKTVIRDKKRRYLPETGQYEEDIKNAACAYEKRDFERAATLYKELCEKSPNDPEVQWKYVQSYFGIVYYEEDNQLKPSFFRFQNEAVDTVARDLWGVCGQNDADRATYEQLIEPLRRIQNEYNYRTHEKYDVFLCYKTKEGINGKEEDTEEYRIAESLYQYLTGLEKKKTVFMAAKTIPTGADWESTILSALVSARSMIVVTDSLGNACSPWVRSEWERFRYLKMLSRQPGNLESGYRYFGVVYCKNADPDKYIDLGWNSEQYIKLNVPAEQVNWATYTTQMAEIVGRIQSVEQAGVTNELEEMERTINGLFRGGYWRKINDLFIDAEFKNNLLKMSDASYAKVSLWRLMAEFKVCKGDELRNLYRDFSQNNRYYDEIEKYGDDELKKKLAGWLQSAKNNLKGAAQWRKGKTPALDDFFEYEQKYLGAWCDWINNVEPLAINLKELKVEAEDTFSSFDVVEAFCNATEELEKVLPPDFKEAVSFRINNAYNRLKEAFTDFDNRIAKMQAEDEEIKAVAGSPKANKTIAAVFCIIPLFVLLFNSFKMLYSVDAFFSFGNRLNILATIKDVFTLDIAIFAKEIFPIRMGVSFSIVGFLVAFVLISKYVYDIKHLKVVYPMPEKDRIFFPMVVAMLLPVLYGFIVSSRVSEMLFGVVIGILMFGCLFASEIFIKRANTSYMLQKHRQSNLEAISSDLLDEYAEMTKEVLDKLAKHSA